MSKLGHRFRINKFCVFLILKVLAKTSDVLPTSYDSSVKVDLDKLSEVLTVSEEGKYYHYGDDKDFPKRFLKGGGGGGSVGGGGGGSVGAGGHSASDGKWAAVGAGIGAGAWLQCFCLRHGVQKLISKRNGSIQDALRAKKDKIARKKDAAFMQGKVPFEFPQLSSFAGSRWSCQFVGLSGNNQTGWYTITTVDSNKIVEEGETILVEGKDSEDGKFRGRGVYDRENGLLLHTKPKAARVGGADSIVQVTISLSLINRLYLTVISCTI